MASPWARRAGDVAPYHVCAVGPTSKIRSDLILEVFRKLTAKHCVPLVCVSGGTAQAYLILVYFTSSFGSLRGR